MTDTKSDIVAAINRLPDLPIDMPDWAMEWAATMLRARAEIERLRSLLADETYIQCKADYNRGHKSWSNYLAERECKS